MTKRGKREILKGDIIAYKLFSDVEGGKLGDTVRFGIFHEFRLGNVEGYNSKQWINLVRDDGSHISIIPSQVVHVFEDTLG